MCHDDLHLHCPRKRDRHDGSTSRLTGTPANDDYRQNGALFFLSCINLITILLLSVYVLHVPVEGNLLSLAFLSWIFIIVSLLLGLLVSTIAKTQVEAMLFSGMVLMMPTVLLSGMIFPVENMPLPLQIISNVIPANGISLV